jgi:hypothetical protein
MTHRIGVFKFRLRLIKLSKVQLLCLPSLTGRNWDYLPAQLSTTFPGPRSPKIMVADIFWFTSIISHPLLLQESGFFLNFLRHEFHYAGDPDVASSFARNALSRDAGGRWCLVFYRPVLYFFL